MASTSVVDEHGNETIINHDEPHIAALNAQVGAALQDQANQFNASYKRIDARNQELVDKLEAQETQTSSLRTELGESQEKVATLEADKTDLEAKNKELAEQVSNLQKQIGDAMKPSVEAKNPIAVAKA